MTSLENRRIVVAGCTGQVGEPIATALAASGNEVHGIARFKDPAARRRMEAAAVVCHAVDLTDPDLGSVPAEVDYLLNFAVAKTGRWDKDLAANAEAAGHLMSHLRNASAVLHCSTTAVYAPTGGAPMREDSALGRDHHQNLLPTYSTVKTAAEAVARFAAREFSLPTTIARLCVPYGDEGGWPVFHLMMARASQAIPVHPDGSRYNPIHHDDIIAQVPALLDAAAPDATTLNWGGDEVVSVEEWTRYICEVVGAPEPVFEVNEFTIPSAVIHTDAVRNVVGPCSVSWKEGFRRLAEHMAAHT
ncbi:MAG: NAD(P)-dependent oxidoreductase [Acidimicrobiaceae bacterium]|nr:NAD(P)-dependent oxidoreductase [Acidimicrobiaceae bacterium]